MQNLNKENFWNPLRQHFPDAVDLFCKWIDNYKREVGWNELFGGDTIKFHDLPFEMQNGILARFDIECFNGLRTGKGYEIYKSSRPHYVNGFENLFKDLQNQLNQEKQ